MSMSSTMEESLHWQWRLSLVAMMLFLVQCCGAVMVPMSDDVMGLMSFKTGLQDPTGALHSWREDDASPCAWAGVTCDRVTSRSVRACFVFFPLESSGLRIAGIN